MKGRRFRARMQEWEEKQKRRAIKLARTQAKAEDRAARKAAAELGSDDEEDPVLAKFAHLAEEDSEEDDISSDDDEVPYADSDAEGGGEGDAARTAKSQYNISRLAAQAKVEQAAEEEEGSDFEVVAAVDNSGSDSDSDGDDESKMEQDSDESEPEPEPTAAKKLSIARHAARQEREAAAASSVCKRPAMAAKSSRKSSSASVKSEGGAEAANVSATNGGSVDSALPVLWHHGEQVGSKHHGRSADKHHGRSKGANSVIAGGAKGGAEKHHDRKGNVAVKGGIAKKPKFNGEPKGGMRGGGGGGGRMRGGGR